MKEHRRRGAKASFMAMYSRQQREATAQIRPLIGVGSDVAAYFGTELELELGLILAHMTPKPMPPVGVCARA